MFIKLKLRKRGNKIVPAEWPTIKAQLIILGLLMTDEFRQISVNYKEFPNKTPLCTILKYNAVKLYGGI